MEHSLDNGRQNASNIPNQQATVANSDKFTLRPPSIALPKGGGAIHGMGEKFSANPVTGTGAMSIPIAISPSRGGFGPQLALSYDSGSGNSSFGLGWSLALPSITRKTDKGLPRYQDETDSDVFVLSGAEDLVPVLQKDAQGNWERESLLSFQLGSAYHVERFCPRIEGLFARIERWTNTNLTKTTDIFWRSISRDNILTIYGADENSRIVDPDDPTQIFSWLICESRDDKGGAIVYEYKPEDGIDIDLTQAHERNRGIRHAHSRTTNRYIKHIRYGNSVSLLDRAGHRPSFLASETLEKAGWMFEVLFDYNEGHITNERITEQQQIVVDASLTSTNDWSARPDPFSTYRAGFDIRTYRLCHRVLMFHHIPPSQPNRNDGYDGLVRSTDFMYAERTPEYDADSPLYSFLASATQFSYEPKSGNQYWKKSLPPVDFTYSQAVIQKTVCELMGESLENLPIGIDGATYQWIDFDGEGISGILTEQAGAWFYKRNISPINSMGAGFAPVELMTTKPGFTLTRQTQFLDLAGDGRPEVVQFDSHTPGFYERTLDEEWHNFVAFHSNPRIDWNDPNLKFIDLDGDGHSDILITEENVFTWYRSLGEDGFDSAEHVIQPWDEEQGPHIVFADGTQSIYLSDMSGDGLTDIVRIRNGEVCYWPNLGYGRFGAKVTMDNSPWFDYADMFDQKRIRLADIDGSGTIDIIYLGSYQIDIYFNRSGNSWSDRQPITTFPRIDNLSSVQVLDLLGNGTACLVWGSPLPNDAGRPMRYIDLMGGQKPHLLIKSVNNLGGETLVEYAPSTKYYLQDKYAGNPWITKLPFPVHCVERVTVVDHHRKTTFSTTYTYHHGYFDGVEREFRGFGRVEQVDVEDYGTFTKGNIASPFITDDHKLYQPPIKTITWFHTGAAVDRQRILTQFEKEYFYKRFPQQERFAEKLLPEPDLNDQNLTADEWCEALRACKGMTLRQEVYELDADALKDKRQHIPVRIFSAATHNCHIQCVQPRGENRHAVFLVTESEALTYHYELKLPKLGTPSDPLAPDPRIMHTLNLSIDDLGNPQQVITVVYPRVNEHDNKKIPLSDVQVSSVHDVQGETHIAYTETHFTSDVVLYSGPTGEQNPATPIVHHRLRLTYEVLTYELINLADPTTNPVAAERYFTLEYCRSLALSARKGYEPIVAVGHDPVLLKCLNYHERAKDASPHLRLVELVRTLYFNDADGINQPHAPLTLGTHGPRGLKYEDYKLALTDDLLTDIFGDKLSSVSPDNFARSQLNSPHLSGYLSLNGDEQKARLAGINARDEYWMRSGVAGFAEDAAQHFYLPEQYTDPFDNITTLEYDGRDLYVQASTDALGNRTEITQFDCRVLALREMKDINNNLTEVYFDILGMVVAVALKGKDDVEVGDTEGDHLRLYDFALANPTPAVINHFFSGDTLDSRQARDWLGNATTRFVYHFGDGWDKDGKFTGWMKKPAGACSIQREKHVAKLQSGEESKLQVALECSDGSGNVLMKKVQAEPNDTGGELRWIINGKTILNNKGKPVKQYEPYFQDDYGPNYFHCTDIDEAGVTPVMYYDAAGRLIRTELPDGTLSRVEFSPWHVLIYDANDTVTESAWYRSRLTATERGADPAKADPLEENLANLAPQAEKRAARLAAYHTNTQSLTILDSLGREVIAVAHNKTRYLTGEEYETKSLTFTKLDAEGKPLWIRDARGNLVMQYILPIKPTRAADELDQNKIENVPANSVPCYDIAGNLLYQHSMDAGNRRMLMDAAGNPMLAWDFNERQVDDTLVGETRLYFTEYDALHRPTAQWLRINNAPPQMIERYEYIDRVAFPPNDVDGNPPPSLVQPLRDNLLGQLIRHYDPSGMVETISRDFKGNVLEVQRWLNNTHQESLVDWSGSEEDCRTKLEKETFNQITDYDALNRMTRHYNWHQGEGSRVAVYKPSYNARGLLESEILVTRAKKIIDGNGKHDYAVVADIQNPRPFQGTRETTAITDIRYNAKGQKTHLALGNGTITEYTYDTNTFRLTRLVTTRPAKAAQESDAVQDLSYTYDPVGNITEITDNAYEPVFFRNQQVRPRSRYTYDALYRLIEAEGRENCSVAGAPPHHEGNAEEKEFPIQPIHPTDPKALRNYRQRYFYDEVGNFLKMRHIAQGGSWTRTYAPDMHGSNRLLGTNTDNPSEATSYAYDTHGNMLNIAKVAPGQQLRWDHRDMIGSLNLGGDSWAYYQYDAGKQRSRKRIERTNPNNVTTVEERIYLGGYELYRRYRGNIGIEDDFKLVEIIESHHLFEGEQRVLLVDDVLETDKKHPDGRPYSTAPIFRYQYGNHVGSTCLELDDDAEIIFFEEYHPYGTSAYRAVKASIEAPPKRYRYTGMERDEESGLNYHTARYYAPWLGRWASADPSGLADGVNRFRYCDANPISNYDGTGMATESKKNYELGKLIERMFEQIITTIAENQSKAGKDSAVTLSTQKGYSRGNSFLDFEFRSSISDDFLRSVDTKGLHLSNYMDAKGNIDYKKLSAKFGDNFQQSLKHINDATKGNKLQNKTASETILYVILTTEEQRKKFPNQIKDVEHFLQVQGSMMRARGSGPHVGVGVVKFEALYERIKRSGQKPGQLSKSHIKTAFAAIFVATLISTSVLAAEPSPNNNVSPTSTVPRLNDVKKSPDALTAKTAGLDVALSNGPVETQAMQEVAKKNEPSVGNLGTVVVDTVSKSSDALAGETGKQDAGNQTPAIPTIKKITEKFGTQSPPGGEFSGKYE